MIVFSYWISIKEWEHDVAMTIRLKQGNVMAKWKASVICRVIFKYRRQTFKTIMRYASLYKRIGLFRNDMYIKACGSCYEDVERGEWNNRMLRFTCHLQVVFCL